MTALTAERVTTIPTSLTKGRFSAYQEHAKKASLYVGNNSNLPVRVGEYMGAKVYNVADYTDVATAYTAAAAAGGRFVIYVPAGDYSLGSSFTWAAQGALIGLSQSASRITCSSGQTLTVTCQYFECAQVEFFYGTQATTGSTLLLNGAFYADIHDIVITAGNIGIEFTGTSPTYSGRHRVSNVSMTSVYTYGLYLHGTHDVFATNVYCLSYLASFVAGSRGIYITGWVEGSEFVNCNFLQFERCLEHSTSTARTNTFTQCYFDSGKYAALLQDTTTAALFGCWFSNGRGQAATAGQGLVVYNAKNVTLDACRFINCGSAGLALSTCSDIVVQGCISSNNSYDSSGTYRAYTADSVTNLVMVGCVANNTALSGGPTQSNTLGVNTATTGVVDNCPSITMFGVGTGLRVNNTASLTKNSGSAVLTSTSVVVTHGLAGTPTDNQIKLVMLGASTVIPYVTAVTATTFTITTSVAPSAWCGWTAACWGDY
jgi:hypothetical protein